VALDLEMWFYTFVLKLSPEKVIGLPNFALIFEGPFDPEGKLFLGRPIT
jgi:hypothetical protein